MNRLFFFIFFFIVLLVEGVEAAVDVRSTRFTTTSGLGNNSVRYMYQDSKGFIWMGTLNGLSRFDGTSFITLNPQLHSRSATYIKRNGLLIRKITIKSSRPFQCAYHPLTP